MSSRIIRTLALAVLITSGGVFAAVPAAKTTKNKPKAGTEQRAGKSRTGKRKTTARPSSAPQGESRADLQRRQKATQQEIAETRQKIQENDRAVSRNLAELGKLEGDIEVSRGQVAESSRKVAILQKQIGTLSGQIGDNEQELARLRQEYLKSLKKIRAKKGTNSSLAYIFSSKSLAEARRRMRYLKEFSAWREKQSRHIAGKVSELNKQKGELAKNKTMQDRALASQVTAQRSLENQYRQKDAIVVELKANGEALKTHLAKKQAEVNVLKNQVASLIAAEQRAAEQRAAEKRAAEKQAAEHRAAEQKRLEAERRAQEEKNRQDLAMAEKLDKSKDTPKTEPKSDGGVGVAKKTKDNSKNRKAQKDESPAKPTKPSKSDAKRVEPKEEPKKSSKSDKEEVSFAQARKRRPRGGDKSETAPSNREVASASSSASASGFESMRGSLPRPVSGPFKITSRFGTHSLPDLPNVQYDNPGIDAEVALGATAQAVYAGKVSGIYMIPGFATVVIVNHGNYYTVYGNLSSASVKVGDVVKQGQGVGRVADSEDNPSVGQIHFEVWKNREKQNPQSWIR